jgi:hypothetical protein
MFTCAYLSYDEFMHLNVKALPRSNDFYDSLVDNLVRCCGILKYLIYIYIFTCLIIIQEKDNQT